MFAAEKFVEDLAKIYVGISAVSNDGGTYETHNHVNF